MAGTVTTLAIETSNPSSAGAGSGWRPGVAVGRVGAGGDVSVLAECAVGAASRRDDELIVAIDGVIRRAGLDRDGARPERVAVCTGPGGYTGVRVAVTTGKMIAEVLGVGCAPVPTALAAAVGVDESGGGFAVALAGKGESAFVTVFERGWRGAGEFPRGELMGVEGLERLRVGHLVADRFLPASMLECAERMGLRISEPVLGPVACLRASALVEDVDPVDLLPLYPREPDAVSQWRRRGVG